MNRHSSRSVRLKCEDDRCSMAGRRGQELEPARLSGRAERPLGRGHLARGSRARRRARERAARPRREKGRRLRDPRQHEPRVVSFDFALALVGAIGAPVYANSSPHDAAYVIGHSESVGVLAEDDARSRSSTATARSSPGSSTPSASATWPNSRRTAASSRRPIPRRSTSESPRSARTTSLPTSTPRARPVRRRAA